MMSELINNREERQRIVKELIKELHQGKAVEDVKHRFRHLLDGIGASELSAVEQKLIEEGMPAEEVKRLCDVHVQVFRESLDQAIKPEQTPGHPVHTFIRENRAVEKVMADTEGVLKQIKTAPAGEDIGNLLIKWRALHQKLLELHRHFIRKENILFPYLEKKGISGPSTVMWAIHDEIRVELKRIDQLLADVGERSKPELNAAIEEFVLPLFHTIKELFYKEENIMYPTALDTLSEADWAEIYNQSDEIGYTLIAQEHQWKPKGDGAPPEDVAGEVAGELKLDMGAMTLEQIDRMLNTLPLDITFVDANDQVKFFSRGKERIFPRSPAIIGRKVQFCHPQASVHIVEKIVSDFRSGQRDVAEFWIDMRGKKIYIRYLAVRDKEGEYLGTVEMTENITEVQQLKGEKRIYEEEGR